jgi:uncharacterized protein YlzI (FlbEa/FlbD family)
MVSFIELTDSDGNKFIGNVELIKRVFTSKSGNTCVVGWNGNGCVEVKETYEEVVEKINNRIFKVLTKKD